MTRLSSWVLCSKWLSPPKRFFAVFPKQFFTLVSRSPAFFFGGGNDCCFRKGSVEASANCALDFSPSLLPGSKLCELLTCLTHANPVPQKTTKSSRCCWGILWAYLFFGFIFLIWSELHMWIGQWCILCIVDSHFMPTILLCDISFILQLKAPWNNGIPMWCPIYIYMYIYIYHSDLTPFFPTAEHSCSAWNHGVFFSRVMCRFVFDSHAKHHENLRVPHFPLQEIRP